MIKEDRIIEILEDKRSINAILLSNLNCYLRFIIYSLIIISYAIVMKPDFFSIIISWFIAVILWYIADIRPASKFQKQFIKDDKNKNKTKWKKR